MKLQVSNGFDYDIGLISRLLGALYASGEVLTHERMSEILGIPQVKIKNLVSLTVASGLMQPKGARLTKAGMVIAEYDQFLENPATLWYCHYNLGSHPKQIVWNYIINQVLWKKNEVTFLNAAKEFQFLEGRFSPYSMRAHLNKELRVLFQAYGEYGLSKLRFFISNGDLIEWGNPAPIPDTVFLAMLLVYRDDHMPGASAISIMDIVDAENSPGRVCRLDEQEVRNKLERLYRNGLVHLESRADLDQVRLRDRSVAEVLSVFYRQGE